MWIFGLNESQNNDGNDDRTKEPTSDSDIEILDKQESDLEASSIQAQNDKIGAFERIDVIKQECSMKQKGILEYLRKKWSNNLILILDLQ